MTKLSKGVERKELYYICRRLAASPLAVGDEATFRGGSSETMSTSSAAAEACGVDGPSSSRQPLLPPAASPRDSNASLLPVVVAVSVVINGAFLFGYHLAVINGPLQAIAADVGAGDSPFLQGLIVSSLLAGGAIGSLGGSGLTDRYGRRSTSIGCCLPLLLGALMTTCATGVPLMCSGRLLNGIGIGVLSTAVPVYVSEVAPARLRGLFGSLNQLLITIGSLAALAANLLFPAEHWRVTMGLSAVPTAVLGLGMWLICPESPRWTVHHGGTEEALRAASWLWGPGATEEFQEALQESSDEGAARMSDVFSPENRRVAVVAIAMFVIQQFAGINALVYFSTIIFQQAGVESSTLASLIVFAINVLGTVSAGALMDRVGRKMLLVGSYSGMGVSMLAMAICMALFEQEGAARVVIVAGTLVYILSFAHGAGPVPMLIIPEMAPHRIRGRAVALAMTSHWVCNLLVGQYFLPVAQTVSVAGVYFFFAAVCFSGAVFSGACLMETKGRSMEDIEKTVLSEALAIAYERDETSQ